MTTPGNELAAILSALALALGCAKLATSSGDDWKTVTFRFLTFSAPPDVTPSGEQGIDSAYAAWKSDSLRISIDAGPFSDRLRSYQNRPNYESREEIVGGLSARVVGFNDPEGSRFVGAHFPSLEPYAPVPNVLTVVVVSQEGVDPDLPRKLLRSIRFRKP